MLERISADTNPRNPWWRKAVPEVRRRKHAIASDFVPPLLRCFSAVPFWRSREAPLTSVFLGDGVHVCHADALGFGRRAAWACYPAR